MQHHVPLTALAHAIAAAAALAAAGCSSAPQRAHVAGLGEPPPAPWLFQPLVEADGVMIRAALVADHENDFDEDLVDEYGILPVLLNVGTSRGTAATVSWPRGGRLNLYLPDGKVCPAVDPQEVAPDTRRLHERVMGRALKLDFVGDYQPAGAAYAYFELPAFDEYSAAGDTITIGEGESARTLALSASLIDVRLSIGETERTFHVGLATDVTREARR